MAKIKDKNQAKKQNFAKRLAEDKKKKKKAKKLTSTKVLIKVTATFNNTIASATDYNGDVIAISSCGKLGFAGSKKSTPYAATKVGEDVATKVKELGAKEAEIVIKGIGVGRQATVKGVRGVGLRITSLSDWTPVPHGGCKPRRAPKK